MKVKEKDMNQRNLRIPRTVTVSVLCTALAFGAVGCANVKITGNAAAIETNATLSETSKWLASSMLDGIDANASARAQDDFYTYVNKDWLIENNDEEKLEKNNGEYSSFHEMGDVMNARARTLLRNESVQAVKNPVPLPAEYKEADEKLVSTLASQTVDWEKRNAKGVEPLRPYVERIAKVKNLQDLSGYLTDRNTKKASQILPVKFTVGPATDERQTNVVIITAEPALSLGDSDNYTAHETNNETVLKQKKNQDLANRILGGLGYSGEEISSLLTKCYSFETKLALLQDDQNAKSMNIEERQQAKGIYDKTLDELQQMQKDFPMDQILKSFQMTGFNRYVVEHPYYFEGLANLYSESNVEEMKAYLIINTILQAATLLDQETYAIAVSEGDPDGREKDKVVYPSLETDEQTDELYKKFINKYLVQPYNQLYLVNFSSEDEKEQILSVTGQVVAQWEKLIQSQDWLSEESKAQTVDKLKNISVRALYPDQFEDYTGLKLDPAAGLVESVASIQEFEYERQAAKTGTPFSRDSWDFFEDATVKANASYEPAWNRITILAGILADDSGISPSTEKLLGGVGAIIGHEISHGFDNTGAGFDKEGYKKEWWTAQDKEAFEERGRLLVNYMSKQIPYPGATSYDGGMVQGEVIADMGGLKCALMIAETIPGFDYDEFFRSFAEVWKCKITKDAVVEQVKSDPHPVGFLRANCTVQQFEKFMETYGVQPEDGMYLAPEERVAVW
ncbi:MAG: M13 family metallopeptidase [Erysipelotrichaceae bacterium]|nr:M13 family metallopeptidase [Erysipelotrichaceae bacterium]